jgi:alanine racemase
MRSDSCLEISLEKLDYNFSLVKRRTNQKILFMVKANAYGHGLIEISHRAYTHSSVRVFGVADVAEAQVLYESFIEKSILDFQIYVFSNPSLVNSQYHYLYNSGKVLAVLESLDDISHYFEFKINKFSPLVLKFNTGMNRLGLEKSDIDRVCDVLDRNSITSIHHIMTHFANSYLPLKEGDKTSKQLSKFESIIKMFKVRGFSIKESSCSNSGAIEQELESHHSFIRPGLMLYGPQSYLDKELSIKWHGKNISALKTTIRKVVDVKRGEPIGYGSPVIHDSGQILYLPLGYGDGILTYYSGATIEINSHKLKIFGRVNMDLTALFSAERNLLKVGDEVSLWEHQTYSINKFANAVKTSAYQVMCAISLRVPRIYK